MMGFWFCKASDLQVGDELRVTIMGGEEYLEVVEAERDGDEVAVRLSWGLHIPNVEEFTDRLPADKELLVRR